MLALWIAWSVLTLVVISLAIARKIAARNDDEYVHLAEGEVAAIPQQVAVAAKLEKIDHWGKTLTVVDVLFGLALVAVLCFNAWQQGTQVN
jgi:hypothetical protein